MSAVRLTKKIIWHLNSVSNNGNGLMSTRYLFINFEEG